MILETKRLRLSEISSADLKDVHALHMLPETDLYNTLGIPEDLDQTKQLLNEWLASQLKNPPDRYVFRIADSSKNFVGLIGLKIGKVNYRTAEVWYKIHPDFWNQGYASEAVKGLLNFGFTTLKFHRITAGCATANVASARVLEKAGFTREGMHRKLLPIRGEWHDNFSYAILETDFFA